MAETVDSLSIELTASTQSAEDSIQKVIDKLTALQSAVTGASNFNRVVQGIARIAAVASGIDGDAGRKLNHLAAGLTALSKVGNLDNLKGAGKNLSSVVSAVNGQTSGGKGLSNLAEGIRQTNNALGSIKESDVGKLGAVQDALSGEVSGSLHTSNVTGESAALGGMGGMDVGSSNVAAALGEIANSAASTGSEFEDLLSKNGELSGELETLLEDATQTSKALTDTGDSSKFAKMSLEEMERTIGSVTEQLQAMAGTAETAGNAVQNAMGGGNVPPVAGPYEPTRTGQFDVAERFANFRMSPLADDADEAGAAFSRFNSIAWTVNNILTHLMGSLGGVASGFGSMSGTLSGLASTLGSVANGLGTVGKAMFAIPKYFGGQLIGNIQKATKGLTGFFHSIVRIAKYRLIRTALRMITQGINEGIKNLYAFSQAAGGTFAASMNQIATASKYLGNSFAAMASPLVEALAPAIDFIVDKFVDMFNTISQIIARLTGKSTYTVAKKVASSWGDAAKSASNGAKDAADDIKRTIMGFDEINKLSKESSSSGGGGGGGGSGGGASSMFEEMPIDGAVSSFADSLKEAFLAGDWQELGTLLGGKVNELVDSIDFAGAGQKVGYYINGWFSTKYWTLDTINFTNIGSKIAEFLNNAIAEIDFNILGRLMVQKMTIIGDLVIGFFSDFDFGQAASSYSDFVKGIYDQIADWFDKYDWGKLGTTLGTKLNDAVTKFDADGIVESFGNALSNAINAGVEFVVNFLSTFNWNAFAQKLSAFVIGLIDKISDAVENVDWKNLGLAIANSIITLFGSLDYSGLAKSVSEFLGAAIGAGIKLISGIGKAIGEKIAEAFEGIGQYFDDKIKEAGGNVVLGILNGILEGIKNIANWIVENIFTPFINGFKNAFGIASPAKKMEEPGENIVLGIFQGIINALANVGQWVIENIFTPIWNAISEAGATAIEIAVSLVKKVGEWASDVWDFLQNTGATIAKTVKAGFEAATSFAGDVWNFIKDGAGTIVKTVNAVFDKVTGFFGDVWNFIKDGAGTIVKTVSAVFDKVTGFFGDVWNFIKDGAGTIVKTVEAIAGEAKNFAGDVWDFITSPDAVSKTVNAVFAFAQNAISDLWDSMSEAWTNFVKGKWLYVNAKATIEPEFGLDPTDPAYEDNVAKLKKLVQMALNTGEWNFPVDMTANFPEGSIDAAKAEFDRLWGEKNPTAPVTPTISDDSWQDEWDKLVGDELDVKVKMNVVKGNVEAGIQTFFDNAGKTLTTTVSTILQKGGTWVNEAWTAITTKSNNVDVQTTLTKNGWTSIGDFVGTVVDVFANLSSRPAEGSSTLPGVFGSFFETLAKLTGKTDDSLGLKGVYGSYFETLSKLTGATEKSLTTTDVYGASFDTTSKLTGKEKGTQGTVGVYGSFFETLVKLTGMTEKSLGLVPEGERKGVFASAFSVLVGLTGKTGDSKDLTQTSKRKGVFASFFTVLSKLTGKDKSSKTLNGVFGDTFTVKATLSSTINGLSEFVSTVAGKLKTALENIWQKITSSGAASGGVITNGRLTRFESGGIINNSFVRKLPHYAGGSTDAHGTLFVAGEAGPEILGHIGGRTEILNQSQLAQTMFAAVRTAMQGVKIAATFYNGDASGDPDADYETMYRAMYDAFTDAMAGSNERDREKVALMRQIAAKEFTAEVTANSVNRAQTRMNRRAGTTIVPVGT